MQHQTANTCLVSIESSTISLVKRHSTKHKTEMKQSRGFSGDLKLEQKKTTSHVGPLLAQLHKGIQVGHSASVSPVGNRL